MATINQRIDAIVKASKAKKNPAKKSAPRKRATGTRVTLVANNPLKVKRETSTNDYALVSGNHWTVRFFANKTEPKGIADITYPAFSEESAKRFVAGLEKAGASGVAVIALRKVRSK